jgi:hypothetical protein
MASSLSTSQHSHFTPVDPIQARAQSDVEQLANTLPDPARMSPDQRRGIIARYTAVTDMLSERLHWVAPGTHI